MVGTVSLNPSPSLSKLIHEQRTGARAGMEPFFARPIYPTGATFNIDFEGEGSEETAAHTKKWNLFFAHTGPQKRGRIEDIITDAKPE